MSAAVNTIICQLLTWADGDVREIGRELVKGTLKPDMQDFDKWASLMLRAAEMLISQRDALEEAGDTRRALDGRRYRYLRERDLDTINMGGVFAGMTPQNVVLNGDDLDRAVDAALLEAQEPGRSG